MKTLPRILTVEPMTRYKLYIVFDDGTKVMYDVGDDMKAIPEFQILGQVPRLWQRVQVDKSRTCICWNDQVDLPSDTLYEYGTAVSQ